MIHADSILVPIIGTGLFIALVAVLVILALDWLLHDWRAEPPVDLACPDCYGSGVEAGGLERCPGCKGRRR